MCSSAQTPPAVTHRFRLFAPTSNPTPNPTRIDFRPRASSLNDTVPSPSSSFYDLLGISESGTLPEIKQAYKQMARKYHPDVSPPDRVDEYTQRFIRVQEAYETLSDPRRRELYDRHIASGLPLAFSSRRSNRFNEELEVRSEWKSNWQSRLNELRRRSSQKDSRGSMSWGARMRRQRDGQAAAD
ncbi:hypothetical protein MLD38_018806 [Melastoma candidum]|uniref:Uncharacterized protein n=1 Tax=Melastoma candidum TaxID=119954 RepID=A0ACB9QUD5_9MYRT|nr:hypothetical protein MLD38_018806 [Melastoma candidum]